MAQTVSSDLAAQVAEFSAQVTPANGRWKYAYKACAYAVDDRFGKHVCFNVKSFATLARFLGNHLAPSSVGYRLGQMQDCDGVDAARAAYYARPFHSRFTDPYSVGALEPWQIGHVYFARVVKAPHIVKIGFSRRVPDRIEDIEAKNKTRLNVIATKVGTLADEQWWHNDWRKFRISGEWFFDPRMADRSLPDFLRAETAVAA